MRLLTEYSIGFIFFCIILGLVYSLFLYRKDKQFVDLDKKKLYLMLILRFVSVFLISFLLLNPLIKTNKETINKPIIIIAQDNSESILMNSDSSFYKKEYKNKINSIVTELSKDYEVKTYLFGQQTNNSFNINYSDKQTNISSFINDLKNKYANRNVGALVLASDGIYNTGSNPVYDINDTKFPIYSIALGDTNVQKDLIISKVNYNKTTFIGNKFPVQVNVEVNQLKGINTELAIYNKNELLFTKTIDVNSDNFSQSFNVELTAKQKGLMRLSILLKPIKSELNLKNNTREIVINVIDSKQNVLILANSPHPDISALLSVLNKNPNYETEFSLIDKFNKPIQKYSLIILHQLPSKTNAITNLLTDVNKNKVPVLFIVGSLSSLNNINALNAGIKINQFNNSFEEASPLLNKQFTLFQVSDEMQTYLDKVPPLIAPFGEYANSVSSDAVLLYQKIKNINTNRPLIVLNNSIDYKIGMIMGEGIWRWRMNNFVQNSNSQLFEDFINKIVQYLALKEKKERFAVSTQNIFNENEPVVFESQVYNESYELINNTDVSIDIVNDKKQKYPFVFNKTENAYRLNAGHFPTGEYSYNSKVKIGNKEFNKSGNFSVIHVNIEATNTVANHQLMYQLTKKTNGKLFYPHKLDGLVSEIKNNKDIVPILYNEKYISDLINNKWIFVVIAAFLFIEWFYRKYLGGY